jgi:hypothetical protein
MRTIQIHDLKQGALALDLREILAALGPRAHATYWTVSDVASSDQALDATGDGADALEELALSGERTAGTRLIDIARTVSQTIWGEFRGYSDKAAAEPWIVIVAVDSSWFEVRSDDAAALAGIRGAFKDVRSAPTP